MTGARRWMIVVATALVLATVGVALATSGKGVGRIGPRLHLLGNGRQLRPQGALVRLGNFPTGGALTPDGRFYWTVSTGRGFNDIRIVSLARRRVVDTVPIPGASGGIAMDPRRALAYVSGIADSTHRDQQRRGRPGRDGDVIQVFRYDRRTGRARFARLIAVPPPSSAPEPQTFPPAPTAPKQSWPDRLAISPNGRTLLVPLNLADAAAIVDTRSGGVRYVGTGHYPYGAAILRDGKTGLVSNETPGTVSAIDLRSGRKLKDLRVGAHLSHPEAIATDPRAPRAFVAVANADQVVEIDTRRLTVVRTLSVELPQGLGSSPTALTVTPDGSHLLVAESGADELTDFALTRPRRRSRAAAAARRVLDHEARAVAARAGAQPADSTDAGAARASAARLTRRPVRLVGRIPTADYPADVRVAATRCRVRSHRHHRHRRRGPIAFTGRVRTRSCPTLVYVAAKGLGVGPNRRGPNPLSANDSNGHINAFRYLPSIVDGDAGIAALPSDRRARALTPIARRQLVPANARRPPRGTPLRPGGPIKHVFYIVKENRSYDQVLGDDPRGDGDRALTLFGKANTPNVHALVRRFPLLDHVYANSEASIDGHFWTSAAAVSDYVNKNWFQNYGGRRRPYDFGVYSVTFPGGGFLFDQAARQKISYYNYGEAIAGVLPIFPDKDRTLDLTLAETAKFAHSDLGPLSRTPAACYPNDADINQNATLGATGQEVLTWDSTPPPGAPLDSQSRFDCFHSHFASQLLTGSVPAFNYLVLPNDHTVGTTPGQRTPRALIADNDYGLGQIVDLISHSPIWRSSAIFVIEDDSQDGADHVDAHRTVATVISPYARAGAVVHTRYDFLSAIRSIELILGLKPLGLFDRLATPMYDAFGPTPANAAPYNAILPAQSRSELNGPRAPDAKLSRSIDFSRPDQVPQVELDRILWQSVHGARSQPPPPGPHAVPGS